MQILLFILYFLLLCFVITRLGFYRNSALSKVELVVLFAIKVAAGVGYGIFYRLPKYFPTSDTWRFYRISLQETQWLKENPAAFIQDVFTHGYSQSGNIFSGHDSYWNDLKSNIPIKLMAVFNLLSDSNYYVNILFFNFLFLFGLVALFRLMSSLYGSNKLLLIACIFLFPSTLFWCSSIHKDGLILSATGLVLYHFHQGLKKGWTLFPASFILLLLVLIFSLRNYVALALLPALLCWWMTTKTTLSPRLIYIGIYTVGLTIFFALPFTAPSLNLPNFLTTKQAEFRALEGGSEVVSKVLHPTLRGYLEYLPTALDMGFLRPHPNEIANKAFLPAVIENFLLLLVLAFGCFASFSRKTAGLTLAFLFFGLSLLMIAGYTVTFSGAIVRYKSFIYPFLVAPILAQLNFQIVLKNIFSRRA